MAVQVMKLELSPTEVDRLMKQAFRQIGVEERDLRASNDRFGVPESYLVEDRVLRYCGL